MRSYQEIERQLESLFSHTQGLTLSPEVLRDVLIEIMNDGMLGHTIKWMNQAGMLGLVFPEVLAMKNVEQDLLHHSEGDVYTHTLLLLEKAKPGVVPQLAALLHDVGKPKTQTIHSPKEVENEFRRIKFLDHENVGAEMSEQILRRMKFDELTITKVSKLVRLHLRAHFSKSWSYKAVRRFIRDCGEDLDLVLHISEIDSLSSFGPNGCPKENAIPELQKRINATQVAHQRKPTLLTGQEVMKLLSLPAGREIGDALILLQDIEEEYSEQGLVLDKEEANRVLKAKFPQRKIK